MGGLFKSDGYLQGVSGYSAGVHQALVGEKENALYLFGKSRKWCTRTDRGNLNYLLIYVEADDIESEEARHFQHTTDMREPHGGSGVSTGAIQHESKQLRWTERVRR